MLPPQNLRLNLLFYLCWYPPFSFQSRLNNLPLSYLGLLLERLGKKLPKLLLALFSPFFVLFPLFFLLFFLCGSDSFQATFQEILVIGDRRKKQGTWLCPRAPCFMGLSPLWSHKHLCLAVFLSLFDCWQRPLDMLSVSLITGAI